MSIFDIEAEHFGQISKDEFPVLIRKLIKDTDNSLKKCTFHARSSNNKTGIDGLVESSNGTLFVPKGKSYWEVTTTKGDNITAKANEDYFNRSKDIIKDKANKNSVPVEDRKISTFVFVVSNKWGKMDEWIEEKKKLNDWDDVLAYDADKLTEWIEDTMSVQEWVRNKIGKSTDGLVALTDYWTIWEADCVTKSNFEFPKEIFAPTIEKHKSLLENFGKKDSELQSLNIFADSPEEGLAFLHCAYQENDNMVLFEKSEAVKKYFNSPSNLIPIFTNRETYEEFIETQTNNPFVQIFGKIRISDEYENKIILDPLTNSQYKDAFINTKITDAKISSLHEESNGCITVLRQRITNKKPFWAESESDARKLIPFMFAGAWRTKTEYNRNEDSYDLTILERLSDTNSKTIQNNFSYLYNIEKDTPVWMDGTLRGVNSKINLFLNLRTYITDGDLRNFFDVTESILLELDSWRNNPIKIDDERQYKKVRVSDLLNSNICDTMKMLSALGHKIPNSDIDCKVESGKIIKKILENLGVETFEAHVVNFSKYAEASPEVFLDIIKEKVLKNEELKIHITKNKEYFSLEQNNSIYLIWALETLAWFPDHFNDVVEILVELAKTNPENKGQGPLDSLINLFRYWAPQTCADANQRQKCFEKVLRSHPNVAWEIMKPQVNGIGGVLISDLRPTWYLDALNYQKKYFPNFRNYCYSLMLKWENPTIEKIIDIIEALNSPALRNEQIRIIDVILIHSKSKNDEEKILIREQLNNIIARSDEVKIKIQDLYDILTPNDTLLKHKHLFDSNQLPLRRALNIKWSQIEVDLYDNRKNAINEIYNKKGLCGIKKFSCKVKFSIEIGKYIVDIINENEISDIIQFVLDDKYNINRENLFCGLFHGLKLDEKFANIFHKVANIINNFRKLSDNDWVYLMTLMPFTKNTWDEVENKNKKNIWIKKLKCFLTGKAYFDFEKAYWTTLKPTRGFSLDKTGDDQRIYAINKLVSTNDIDNIFYALRLAGVRDFEDIDNNILLKIINKIYKLDKITFNEKSGSNDYYYFEKIITKLEHANIVSQQELAMIELFLFGLEIFGENTGVLKSLDNEFSESPKMLCKFITLCYEKDPEKRIKKLKEVSPDDELFVKYMFTAIISNFFRTPGINSQGKINHTHLANWINEAREIIPNDHELSDKLEAYVGNLLGKSPASQESIDGKPIWPDNTIAEIIEEIATEVLVGSIVDGRENTESFTERFLDEGGEIERTRSAYYRKMKNYYQGSHPKVAGMLNILSIGYRSDAQRQDEIATLFKRGEMK